MGFSPRNVVAALSLAAAVAQAVPDVEPVLVEGGCAAYPNQNAGADLQPQFLLQADQCTNSTTGEPCSIEGFGSGTYFVIKAGDTGVHQGYVSNRLILSFPSPWRTVIPS